jgi:hypothetical protein
MKYPALFAISLTLVAPGGSPVTEFGNAAIPDASAGVGFDAYQAVLDFFLRHARP